MCYLCSFGHLPRLSFMTTAPPPRHIGECTFLGPAIIPDTAPPPPPPPPPPTPCNQFPLCPSFAPPSDRSARTRRGPHGHTAPCAAPRRMQTGGQGVQRPAMARVALTTKGGGGLCQEKRTFTGALSASWSWDLLYFKVGGWRLASVSSWRLLAVGGWRRLAVGDWWSLALSLRAVLTKNVAS